MEAVFEELLLPTTIGLPQILDLHEDRRLPCWMAEGVVNLPCPDPEFRSYDLNVEDRPSSSWRTRFMTPWLISASLRKLPAPIPLARSSIASANRFDMGLGGSRVMCFEMLGVRSKQPTDTLP